MLVHRVRRLAAGRRWGSWARWTWSILCSTTCLAGEFQPDFEAAPHAYFEREPRDRFQRTLARLAASPAALDRSGELAFVRSLLAALDVPESSQLLVFSNTSLQLGLINPSNPRALYFSDDVYVGWVPGGKIEVAAVDPDLGAVFYLMPIPGVGEAPKPERSRRCMNCHANEDTLHVPGLSIRSVAPASSGGSLDSFRAGLSGHAIPVSQRLGGWHVTGDGDGSMHLGNRMGRLQGGEVQWTPLEPGRRFPWGRYPVSTSDLLAHLLHEHQSGAVNRMARAQYLAREAGTSPSAEALARLDREARDLARYLLFADEAPLPGGLEKGDARFREDFLRARRVVEGRSLRDLDLRSRLLRHRCSYMVHTAQFDGLLPVVRDRVLAWMSKAVAPGRGPDGLDHLDDGEKSVIRGILSREVRGFRGS